MEGKDIAEKGEEKEKEGRGGEEPALLVKNRSCALAQIDAVSIHNHHQHPP